MGVDLSAVNFLQEPISSPNRWGEYFQADNDMECNSIPSTSYGDHGGQQRNSFEVLAIQKLDDLQAQMDEMSSRKEDIVRFTVKVFQAELEDTEKNFEKRFEKCLKAYEERSFKRMEDYFKRITKMSDMLDSRIEVVHQGMDYFASRVSMVDYHIEKLQQRVEQLNFEMCKARGEIIESDSDDDWDERTHLLGELPGYIDEPVKGSVENDGLEIRHEPTSPTPCAYNENEQVLCEDIVSSRSSRSTNEVVRNYSVDRESVGEWGYMACTPVEERECSPEAESTLSQEKSPFSPRVATCYSCEPAYAPQVQACFGVLASSAYREKSHEEMSWEEKEQMVDLEVTREKSKKRRPRVAQVWIPRGTLKVMKVFNMTQLNLGEKNCVPQPAKKRKRRKSSTPQGDIG